MLGSPTQPDPSPWTPLLEGAGGLSPHSGELSGRGCDGGRTETGQHTTGAERLGSPGTTLWGLSLAAGAGGGGSSRKLRKDTPLPHPFSPRPSTTSPPPRELRGGAAFCVGVGLLEGSCLQGEARGPRGTAHRASQGGLEAPAENADPWAHAGPVNPKPPSRVPLADRWGPPKVLAHPGSKRLPVLHVSLQGAWQTEQQGTRRLSHAGLRGVAGGGGLAEHRP